jgi:hypothetical protein
MCFNRYIYCFILSSIIRPFLKTKTKHILNHIRHSGFTRRLIGLLLAFLILVPTILLILRPKEVAAVWFDDNYTYRQKFTFTHNADITSPRFPDHVRDRNASACRFCQRPSRTRGARGGLLSILALAGRLYVTFCLLA